MKIFILLFIPFVLSAQINKNDWRYDLEDMSNTLPELHAAFHKNYSRKEFKKDIADIISTLDSSNDIQIALKIQASMSKVGEIHTEFSYNKFLDTMISPIDIYKFSDGLYVAGAFRKYEKYIGKKVISINGCAYDSLVHLFHKLEAYENENSIQINFSKFISYMDISQFIFKNKSPFFVLKFQDSLGIYIDTIPFVSSIHQFYNFPFPELPFQKKRPKKESFHLEYNDSLKILYIDINKMYDDDHKFYLEEGEGKNANFWTSYMIAIEQYLLNNKVDKIVIDLRGNGGGNNYIPISFTKFIDEKFPQYKNPKKLFCLISYGSLSMSIIFAHQIKKVLNGTIVGRVPGEAYNLYGNVKSYQMRRTNTTIRYATEKWKLTNSKTLKMVPDIQVERSFTNFSKGIDEDIDSVIGIK